MGYWKRLTLLLVPGVLVHSLTLSNQEYRLKPEGQTATLLVRPRGWHMEEKHFIVDGEPCRWGVDGAQGSSRLDAAAAPPASQPRLLHTHVPLKLLLAPHAHPQPATHNPPQCLAV